MTKDVLANSHKPWWLQGVQCCIGHVAKCYNMLLGQKDVVVACHMPHLEHAAPHAAVKSCKDLLVGMLDMYFVCGGAISSPLAVKISS